MLSWRRRKKRLKTCRRSRCRLQTRRDASPSEGVWLGAALCTSWLRLSFCSAATPKTTAFRACQLALALWHRVPGGKAGRKNGEAWKVSPKHRPRYVVFPTACGLRMDDRRGLDEQSLKAAAAAVTVHVLRLCLSHRMGGVKSGDVL
jgi:hypothetical protein